MQANWIRTCALTAVLGGAGLLFGQGQAPPADTKKAAGQPPPAVKPDKEAPKTKLEEMLQQAMRNNADIRVAEAKLATAEAEVNRTRLVVMQKVILYNANLGDAKAKVEQADLRLKRIQSLAKANGVSREELETAEAALQSAKADLAKVEAELPLLLGTPPADKARAFEHWRWGDAIADYDSDGRVTAYERIYLGLKQPVQGPMADRIKKALDQQLKVSFQNQDTRDALEFLLQHVDGVSFKIQLAAKELGPETINFTLGEEVTLGAALQAFQDSVSPTVRFVVRDYGILVTDQAHVPPGAPLLYDVWKGENKYKGGKEKASGKNPDVKLEGVVKEVDVQNSDAKGSLVSISIGSDAGLKKGDKLAVLRTDPKTKALSYLAQIKIVAVEPGQAVGQRTDEVQDQPIKPGDKVTTQLNID